MTFSKVYAERPATLARQLLADAFAVLWICTWIRLSFWVYDLIEKLGVPGEKLEGAGDGLAVNLAGAGRKADSIPGVGDSLAAQFKKAADAAKELAAAGQQQQQVVDDLAMTLAVILAIVPIALVLVVWLPMRLRWIRRATMAARLRDDESGNDLLALRALANQPLRRLTKLDPAIAAAWRRGDPESINRLAALELRGLGLARSKVR